MAYLDCSGIYKEWRSPDGIGDVTVDISLSAQKATMTSIVGPSGSGKSTVLRIIAGLLKCDSQGKPKIVLDGTDITNLAPGKRDCGLVFQNGSLFLNMTVQDNVAYGLCCRGWSRRDARKEACEFLKLFNMQDFATRYPETLSGGEAQRVALARTLIVKPKLVLLDEPLSAMDTPLRKKLASEIVAMQKKFGFTSIMVTHDLNEAKMMSDTILLMKNGRKMWEGRADSFDSSIMETSSTD